MTQEEFKQTLKDKLKECDKNTLMDNLCLVYIGAMVDMISAKCMQQQLSNVQTNIQEIDNFIIKKVNTNLYETRK